MSSEQPKIFYRYQQFNTRSVESLCHDNLYFADPTSFNDPLDCDPDIESDSSRNDLRLILTELISRRIETEAVASLKNMKFSGKNAVDHAKKLGEQSAKSELAYIEYQATNPEYKVKEEVAECCLLTSKIQHELINQYDRGVCCFSSVVDNPLLWSHYGDQHRGLCVGYSRDRSPLPKLHRVEYGGSRVVTTSLIAQAHLVKDPNSQELLDRSVLLRKASPWRYEREWRLIGNRGTQNSPLALKDVTFGLRCPSAVTHAVVSSLESRDDKIKFYEMIKVSGSFKLKRRLLELAEMSAYLPNTARSGIEIFGPIKED